MECRLQVKLHLLKNRSRLPEPSRKAQDPLTSPQMDLVLLSMNLQTGYAILEKGLSSKNVGRKLLAMEFESSAN